MTHHECTEKFGALSNTVSKREKMIARKWLLEQCSSTGLEKLKICEKFETGRGVATDEDIQPGESILKVPLEAIITGKVFFKKLRFFRVFFR